MHVHEATIPNAEPQTLDVMVLGSIVGAIGDTHSPRDPMQLHPAAEPTDCPALTPIKLRRMRLSRDYQMTYKPCQTRRSFSGDRSTLRASIASHCAVLTRLRHLLSFAGRFGSSYPFEGLLAWNVTSARSRPALETNPIPFADVHWIRAQPLLGETGVYKPGAPQRSRAAPQDYTRTHF